MDILDQIVERRLAEAVERGEFNDLPGAGRPLQLDDDPLVPAELRVAFRIMKNAGYVPDEVRLFAELRSAEQLLMQADRDEERVAASVRVRLLLERLGSGRAMTMQVQSQPVTRPVVGLALRARLWRFKNRSRDFCRAAR